MVPGMGLEPIVHKAAVLEAAVYTNSTIPAYGAYRPKAINVIFRYLF